ncbi:MAG: tRNA preQ1(34) S-adenosylmethionine ribosyltransferase-isomerase QueA [Dehalococcoidia bacterium]|nr:tRNA preQ1(34) S-adenosylmethionine ribosyltransferase-isomerase QueA [Dehalococcoidia bacterium]
MKTADFDYSLPPELIAQTPLEPRDSSRLLILNRTDGSIKHHRFFEIGDYLRDGDVLVMNNSRVIPARLFGKKADTGAVVEILLLRRSLQPGVWEALVRPGRKLPVGTRINLVGAAGSGEITAEVCAVLADGIREVIFSNETALWEIGVIPLPPYIHAPLADPKRYQTVYAKDEGSAAAPTAGLHFTPQLLEALKGKGVQCLYTTLHIGLDTFRPVSVENPAEHHIHREYGVVSEDTAARISLAKSEGRRVICVGTTSVRVLEHAAAQSKTGLPAPFAGWVDLLILPGYRFKAADAMLTNFHLPRSTLVMMVSAFAGTDAIKKAYAEAVREKYRFYSFGDAMLIL